MSSLDAANNWAVFTQYAIQAIGDVAWVVPDEGSQVAAYPLVSLPDNSVAPGYAQLRLLGRSVMAGTSSVALGERVLDFVGRFGLLGIGSQPYATSNVRDWRRYREPLGAFLECARSFAKAFDAIALYVQPNPTVEYEEAEQGLNLLHGYAAGAELLTGFKDNGLFMAQAPASLISLLAWDALADLAGRRNVAVCRMCGELVLDRNSNRIYCSTTCANRNSKRMERSRNKQKEVK